MDLGGSQIPTVRSASSSTTASSLAHGLGAMLLQRSLISTSIRYRSAHSLQNLASSLQGKGSPRKTRKTGAVTPRKLGQRASAGLDKAPGSANGEATAANNGSGAAGSSELTAAALATRMSVGLAAPLVSKASNSLATETPLLRLLELQRSRLPLDALTHTSGAGGKKGSNGPGSLTRLGTSEMAIIR